MYEVKFCGNFCAVKKIMHQQGHFHHHFFPLEPPFFIQNIGFFLVLQYDPYEKVNPAFKLCQWYTISVSG